MSALPEEIRKQLRSFISKTTDDSFDLIINLSGKYITEKRREKLKQEAELKFTAKFEQAMTKAYNIGIQLQQEHEKKRIEPSALKKDDVYRMTDTVFKALMPEIPKRAHALDYLFGVFDDLKDFRFNWRYLKDTKYATYVQDLNKLVNELNKDQKITQSWEILMEFKNSKDAYLLLQATFQRLISCYEFLNKDFSAIRKKHIDKYLEIYGELAGHFEKLISLIVALIWLLRNDANHKYEAARKKTLFQNITYVEKSEWKIFVQGYNRNLRNAIAHKGCKIDILKENVELIDRNKTITLTFDEIQEETRELSALLLIFPHLFISVFSLPILSIREMLNKLETSTPTRET